MCGICGIIDYNKNASYVNEALIHKMCIELEHRGPDDEGIFVSEGDVRVGLGHRRLSIIDLSMAGHQPMFNEDKTISIVFNGEIYNYAELRIELEEKGHLFKSHTDTETLLHLYEEYGADECLKRLRGMFAFALWDSSKKTLFLARDRAGKKPLLYYHRNGIFCFASEFTAILASGVVEKDINYSGVDYYFTYGYIPAPFTIYRGVFKLPSAHMLILKDNNVFLKKYWEIDYSKKINISEHDAKDELMRLVKEAVEIRLHSDVPVGAFLSGGIDSSTVVALMSQLSASKVKTFSVGFDDKNYNELKYARKVAEAFGTEHHEFIVKPKALEILPLLTERYGEPYADSSCIPTFYVAHETKKFVTVALSGDGGDESFAGYERYYAMLIAELLQKMPTSFRRFMRLISRCLPDASDSKNTLRRIRRFFDAASLPFLHRYMRWIGIFNQELKSSVYSPGFTRKINFTASAKLTQRYLDGYTVSNALDCLLSADVHMYLPDDLLVKVDIASMANSLETRSPLLDQKVMEFAASLPAHYKLNKTTGKYILKKAAADLLPRDNIHRVKMGFGVPVGKWFRAELKDFLIDNLLSAPALKRGYFNPKTVKFMVKSHIDKTRDYTFQLWAMLMFELWHKRFIDN